MSHPRRIGFALTLVLVMLAIIAPGTVAAAGRFSDDNGSRYEKAIEAVAAAGVMPGCTTHHFCPKTVVTKGKMAVYLARALHLKATVKTKFKDVPSSLASGVKKVVAAGLMKGCSTTRFCPDSSITRGRMAALLVKALHLTATGAGRYKDVPKSHKYATAIERLRTAGLAVTCASGKFCPDRKINRAETAAFLAKVMARTTVTPPPPSAGNPDGGASIPSEGQPVDTSSPDHVVGTGTPASCTGAAVAAAVAKGGIITFDCGPNPVTIPMTATAKVFNDRPDVVLDGGGLVTLDGQGARRILYQNTCDQAQHWTTDHCQDQDHPVLTVQHLVFANGRSSGTATMDGGGAIFVRGGRFRVIDSQFYGNRCASTGPDIGGAAIQVFSQYHGLPVYVVHSTFGGSGDRRNECSNGGAISSIGVSWTILNSAFSGNKAIGTGANPAKKGTPGGGNGGAIYNDGNTMLLHVEGTTIEGNTSNHEGGSGIFYVSNDRSGSVEIVDSILRNNNGDGFSTYPGIFFLGSSITFTGSTVE
jgi:S-layer homology domain